MHATDPNPGATLTYSLSGTVLSNFLIDAATGAITVASGATMDFETTPTYVISASVTNGIESDMIPLTITLTNVNEAPTKITVSWPPGERGREAFKE